MTFLRSLKFGTALAALMVAGVSAPGVAETLQEAMSQAYVNNPDLRAQRAALRATDERVAAANLAVLPSLNGNLFYQRSSQDTIVGGIVIGHRQLHHEAGHQKILSIFVLPIL